MNFSIKSEKIPIKESEDFDQLKKVVSEENMSAFALLTEDRIGKKIFLTIEKNWKNISAQEIEKLSDLLNNLLELLSNYHAAFINLKTTSRRHFYFDDIEKYQESVKRAENREIIAHNAFIDSLNILSRNMKSAGLDNSWRGEGKIYSTSERETRDRTRNWMVKIFKESL